VIARGLGLPLLMVVCGCAAPARSIVEVFPPGSVAAPWVLQNEVWAGDFEAAAPALGDDAALWREYAPLRVWLAVYTHEDSPKRCLKVRCFVLASREDARRGFEAQRPVDVQPLKYGDAGCWTDIGVLFWWGRLVVEVFGPDASWASQVQSAMLATFIAKRMPLGLIENPR
jgi:hypothetical protein